MSGLSFTHRRSVSGAALLTMAMGVGCLAESAPARADDGTVSGGRVVVEGLVLWRDDPSGKDFTGSDTGPGVIIRTEDLDPDAGFGLRVSGEASASRLGFMPAGWSWQVVGMYVSGIKGDVTADDPTENTSATYVADLGGIVSPQLNDANSDQIGGIRLDLASTIAGTESNWLTPNGSVFGGRAFIGSRFIQYREHLDAILFDAFPPGSGDDNHIVDIKTRNNMYGVQIGWEGYVPLGSAVSIGGRFAGGLFANNVERKRAFSDQDTPGNAYSDEVSETEFAQLLEANPKIMIDLGGGVSVNVGGTVIWLNNVSEASDQWVGMLNLDDRDVRADEDVLLYGVTFGMTFKFD